MNFIKKIIPILIFIMIIFVFLMYKFVDFNSIGSGNTFLFVFGILLVILFIFFLLYIIVYLKNKEKTKELKHRDKLFNSLVKNSDTIYLMLDQRNREITYTTHNFKDVLGIEIDENTREIDVLKDIFRSESLRSQMDNWDEESEFVSQMFSYRNPKYQHTRWIKMKIYPFVEKKSSYLVVLVSDATKEHEKQHLLVTQASDIKTREKQLNQITSLSYDMEIDINISANEYKLKNLKENIRYFGDSRSGKLDEEFIKNIIKYVALPDSEKVINFFSLDNLSKENNEPLSIRYCMKNGEVWLESTAFFTTDKGDKIVTILTKDVTENAEYMRKQNMMLQDALKNAKDANQAKSEFISIMSHEIRTPMNAIIGLSESVLAEPISEEARDDIENINSASNNLLEVIDSILDISKIESGVISLEEKEYSVSKFFKDVLSISKERISNSNVKLVQEIDENLPSKLFGDKGKIRQILLNLISNSIKFTNEGLITIKASGKKIQSNLELKISIIDTGIGIEKEKLSRLFDESKKINDKNYIGGMGLTISKKMIDLLNGTITAESEIGKGSIFTIKITQKIIDEKPIGNIELFKAERKKQDVFDASSKRILIVDDNKLNIRVAEKLLKPYNVSTTSALSGQECIDILEKSNIKFDLILLDQMMPNMDGIETLKNLKNIDGFNTPVVVLTADAIVGVKEKYLSAGFADYLSKPINVEELNELLKKYLV